MPELSEITTLGRTVETPASPEAAALPAAEAVGPWKSPPALEAEPVD